jgi:hypothetical protein
MERLTMQSPAGTLHMVLARDRAAFEARGYRYVGPFGEERVSADVEGSTSANSTVKVPRTRKSG